MTTTRFVRLELVNGGAMYVQMIDIVKISPSYQGVFCDGPIVTGQCLVTHRVAADKTEAFRVVGDPDDVAKTLVS